jgi:LemA protein
MAAVLALVILCGVVAYFASTYNGLISLRRQTANAFAQIEIQLRRRYDLIPNLMEIVKAHMGHEREIFGRLSEARNRATQAETVSERAMAESDVRQRLFDLYVVVEDYPDLKSDAVMQSLQAELRNTEDKIAFARQYYNDVVTAYNIGLDVFPTNVLAKASGFAPKELFVIEEPSQRENVRVAF